MVDIENFYSRIKVFGDLQVPIMQRVKPLFDEVIEGLPDEEQFQIKGRFVIHFRSEVIKYWSEIGSVLKPLLGTVPDFIITSRDGNCTYTFGDSIEHSLYYITIVLDELPKKSDDYIKGLFAHEFAELSFPWRTIKEHRNELQKLRNKAKDVRINQLTKKDSQPGTPEYHEHEKLVNQEAVRLGFQKEITALENETPRFLI